MSNEIQEPDSTPDNKPESAHSADAANQLNKEERERDDNWPGMVMRVLQWVIKLTPVELAKLCAVIAFAGFIWWLIHGGR